MWETNDSCNDLLLGSANMVQRVSLMLKFCRSDRDTSFTRQVIFESKLYLLQAHKPGKVFTRIFGGISLCNIVSLHSERTDDGTSSYWQALHCLEQTFVVNF